eukprot:TRINITY_DN122234_c0_g1_i1.p1 TRINITY_DN122234_c0_g1~~TRINITY_DN122234_c0_g1_i1.p1  ORF type:complete len:1061 (-),score=242.85 TRINITY_DN122234_c0_g1_i1:504-3686(-)
MPTCAAYRAGETPRRQRPSVGGDAAAFAATAVPPDAGARSLTPARLGPAVSGLAVRQQPGSTTPMRRRPSAASPAAGPASPTKDGFQFGPPARVALGATPQHRLSGREPAAATSKQADDSRCRSASLRQRQSGACRQDAAPQTAATPSASRMASEAAEARAGACASLARSTSCESQRGSGGTALRASGPGRRNSVTTSSSTSPVRRSAGSPATAREMTMTRSSSLSTSARSSPSHRVRPCKLTRSQTAAGLDAWLAATLAPDMSLVKKRAAKQLAKSGPSKKASSSMAASNVNALAGNSADSSSPEKREKPKAKTKERKASSGYHVLSNQPANNYAHWRRLNGVPEQRRVFSMYGNQPALKVFRQALLSRGWILNEDPESPYWDLKFPCERMKGDEVAKLAPEQVVSYFVRDSEITTKSGLCRNMRRFMDGPDVDTFFPRCYDLSNTEQFSEFMKDFKATRCLNIVRRFVTEGAHAADDDTGRRPPLSVVRAALGVCQRRLREEVFLDESLDDPLQPLVDVETWHLVRSWSANASKCLNQALKGGDKCTNSSQKKATGTSGQSSDTSSDSESTCSLPGVDDLLEESSEVLGALAKHLPQFGLDGMQNIWIIKPVGKSRGRGIRCSDRLASILELGKSGRGRTNRAEASYVVQKYIENPLIIQRKKFDIRQWVVVSRWNPLAVWFYKDCYLRFSYHDYDPKDLSNRFAHLTNNAISKKAEGFEQDKDETMMHSDDFQKHLAGLGLKRANGEPMEDPWLELVQPRMKEIVRWSMESVQDSVVHRDSSWELFGYDFMVDEDLNTWLIEVNSAPDISFSTSTTATLVTAMMEDMAKVVVDVEKFGQQLQRPRRRWSTYRPPTGRYELLEAARREKEERFYKMRRDCGPIFVRGAHMKLQKPKRGEEVVEEASDPRYDAAAMLAREQWLRDSVDAASVESDTESSESSAEEDAAAALEDCHDAEADRVCWEDEDEDSASSSSAQSDVEHDGEGLLEALRVTRCMSYLEPDEEGNDEEDVVDDLVSDESVAGDDDEDAGTFGRLDAQEPSDDSTKAPTESETEAEV